MAQVMQQYKEAEAAGKALPRVLSLTASPAAGPSVAATSVLVEALRRDLGGAELLVVDEGDPDVAAVLASPSEEVLMVRGCVGCQWLLLTC